MPLTLDEELQKIAEQEQDRAEELEGLKQEQRKKRLDRVRKLARAGQLAAALSGNEELYNLLGEGGDIAQQHGEGEHDPGLVRRAASNYGGKVAGGLGKELGGLSRGKGAALGGAVAGALQGEGATGIAKSAISWWVLDLVFASLFTIIGFIPALLYLDFHFIANKLGSKLFGAMNLWQKLLLLIANLIGALIPLAFVLLVYIATCGNTLGSTLSTIVHYGSLGYVQDFCSAFQGGRSGGGSGLASGKLTDAEARQQLRLGNINVNAPRPTTSLEGVNVATMLEVVRFKRECDAWSQGLGPVVRGPCDVVVTGGTEGGHAGGTCSHANGYKVDIRANDTVDRYIQANSTPTVDRDDRSGAVRQYVSNSGSIYAREANHWDILVGCGQTLIET